MTPPAPCCFCPQGLHEDNTRRVAALSQSRAAAASLRMETATGAELQALENQAAVTANGLLVPPSPSQAPVTQVKERRAGQAGHAVDALEWGWSKEMERRRACLTRCMCVV